MSHLDISGKEVNDKQPRKMQAISTTLPVFHFDMSGNEINDEQL